MADQPITITTAANHIPTIWSSETIDAVEGKVVLAGLVDRHFEKQLKVGDTLNIPFISNMTATAKTGASNITLNTITEQYEQITCTTHEHVAFAVEDIVAVQSNTGLRSKYTKKAGYVIGASMDETIAALAANFSQYVGTLGLELTDDNLIRAWQYLEDFDMPESDRFIYISPAAYAGLMKLDKFMHADYVGGGGKGVRNAFVGKLYGANVHTSTLTYKAAANQCAGWFCHKSGVALIQQHLKTTSQYSIHEDADVVLSTNLFGLTEIVMPPKTEGGAAGSEVDYANVYLKTIS